MRNKFASLVAVLTLLLLGSVTQLQAQDDSDGQVDTDVQTDAGAQVRLTARNTAIINGIRAELRGDFRSSGAPIRLNAELENLNLPLGTPVAFCLVQNGVTSKAGVGRVILRAGVRVAEIQLEARDGDNVPVVNAGNRLQARQSKTAPFNRPATCSSPLLVGATFR